METFHPGVSVLSTPTGVDTPSTSKWVSVYHWPPAGYAVPVAPLHDIPDMKWALFTGVHPPLPNTYPPDPSTLHPTEPHAFPITAHDTSGGFPYNAAWITPTNHTAPTAAANIPSGLSTNATSSVIPSLPTTLATNHSSTETLPTTLSTNSEWTSFTRKDKPGHNGVVNSGPIPANPLRIYKDANGVDWISFAYSRERIRTEYTIRGDVETVDLDTLTEEFKHQNCIYPRARVPPEQYTGTRHRYETECNAIGWALAKLNPCLRNKRGLIQRAVDSWRNKEPSLRSRRIRRMVALNDIHCVREHENVSRISPSNQESPLPPQFLQVASAVAYRPVHDGQHAPFHEISKKSSRANNGNDKLLKKPKYILLDDIKKDTRVRVRVSLDEVDLEEIPDAFRRDHCVFPRRFVPMHTSYGEPQPTYEHELQTEEAKKEQMINEIGWKLAWLNMRLFANRPSFLQRAVDAYRNKIELVTCEEKWGTRKGRKAWFNKTCS